MMNKICVLIRVYDRLEDLVHCVEIIRKTWKRFDYYIMVVSNGKNNGFVVNDSLKVGVDRIIELESNDGHLKGNAQLLQEGLPYIPTDCDYTILLEADTWVYGDDLIEKYVGRLKAEDAVWASAHWYSHIYSLATDFVILSSGFLKQNPQIFKYTGYPECYAANYMLDNNFKFTYITENMPVHLPSYIKNYPFTIGIRFNVFPKSKMVTHHVEVLKGGMKKKMFLFNTLAATDFFKGANLAPSVWMKRKINFAIAFSLMFPIKGMFVKIKKLNIQ